MHNMNKTYLDALTEINKTIDTLFRNYEGDAVDRVNVLRTEIDHQIKMEMYRLQRQVQV